MVETPLPRCCSVCCCLFPCQEPPQAGTHAGFVESPGAAPGPAPARYATRWASQRLYHAQASQAPSRALSPKEPKRRIRRSGALSRHERTLRPCRTTCEERKLHVRASKPKAKALHHWAVIAPQLARALLQRPRERAPRRAACPASRRMPPRSTNHPP